jgi:uncharacterized protein YjbJ (UPF0337 family)
MDENRIAGTARNIGGKVEEAMGRVTGDTKVQIRGIADQAAGAARDSASSMEKWLRNTIETQPCTAAMVAFGIGWLLGRMHRPL